MSLKFLFQDIVTGLWLVDESTGVSVNLSALPMGNTVDGGIATLNDQVYFATSSTQAAFGPTTRLWVSSGGVPGTRLVTTLPDSTPAN